MYSYVEAKRIFSQIAAEEGWILRPELWAKHAPQEVDTSYAGKFRAAVRLLSTGTRWYYDKCLKVVVPANGDSYLSALRSLSPLARYEQGYEKSLQKIRENDGAPRDAALRLEKMSKGKVYKHRAWLGKLVLGLEEAHYALRFESKPEEHVAAFLRQVGFAQAEVDGETRFLSTKRIREITPGAALLYEDQVGQRTRFRMFQVDDPTGLNTAHPVTLIGFSCVGDTQQLLHIVARSDPWKWDAHKGSTEYDPFMYWVKHNSFTQ